MDAIAPAAAHRLPPAGDGEVVGVCPHDCADTCSIVSTVRGGRLIAVRGNPRHPVTRGFVCRKLARAPAHVHGEGRILRPLLRDGPKGAGRFRPASWDEAVAAIAGRWRRILAEDGPYAILPFFGSGTEGLVNGHLVGRRFFNRLGTLQLVRTICTKAGRTGYRLTMGTSQGAEPTAAAGAGLVVAWGLNASSTNIHQAGLFAEARKAGAAFAVVNPLRIKGAEGAELAVRPRPGTDAALALGVMHLLVAEGRHDAGFLARCTVGFEKLAERLKEWPPERAAAVAEVPAAEVHALARLFAERRPAFVYVGPGCQRHSNGGMTLRTLACLPALTGAWARPGGGLYFPTSTVFPVDWEPLEGEEMRPTPAAGYNMIHLGRLLAGGAGSGGPPVRSLYVFNGNPAAVLYNQALVRAGLARDDLFTVVHEQVLTDTARFADVILPAASQWESPDLFFSYYHPSLLLNRPALPPQGEARSNLETFAALAAALDFTEPCFGADAWQVMAEVMALPHPALAGITLERLLADGWAPAAVPPLHHRFVPGRTVPEDEKIRLWSAEMAAAGRDPLPTYVPPRESRDGSPALFARYPLALLTPSGHSFLNSAYGAGPGFVEGERRPAVLIHPDDAAARGIADGALAELFNDRGRCRLWARVTADVRPGVLVAAGQWWSRHYPGGGNANFTTPDFPADMGGGSAFNSNLVEAAPAVEDGP
jgi:anaerobic selenocysteine-containing dehydrogenase